MPKVVPRITGLFEWLDKWDYHYGFRIKDEDPEKLFINLCKGFGYQDEYPKSRIRSLKENLLAMEMLCNRPVKAANGAPVQRPAMFGCLVF